MLSVACGNDLCQRNYESITLIGLPAAAIGTKPLFNSLYRWHALLMPVQLVSNACDSLPAAN
jgi:hypothetical protein